MMNPLQLLLVSITQAATLSVGSSGADYDSIQDAIDGATGGDRIEVAAGLYREQIDFDGKDVEVVGVDGSGATMIDWSGGGRAVSFTSGEGPAALLEGFTIRAVGSEGIAVVGGSPTLRDLVLFDNAGAAGPALGIDRG